MNVLVFDIDGTLTETSEVDGRVFKAAVEAVLPNAPDVPHTDFPEFTDSAILRRIWEACSSRDYLSVEDDVRRRFMAGLETAVVREPEAFRPVAGARHVFDAVRRAGWTPAMATGAWRESAKLKLAAARIPVDGVPLATSSDEVRRVDIIQRAVGDVTAGKGPATVVYVGDGVWDLRACRELGIGFIGRTTPETDGLLSRSGARATIPDFEQAADLVGLLSDSSVLTPR